MRIEKVCTDDNITCFLLRRTFRTTTTTIITNCKIHNVKNKQTEKHLHLDQQSRVQQHQYIGMNW